MTLARPNGRPNDTLEAFLDHLVTHEWHLGDSFGTSKRHWDTKCAFGSTFGDLFSVVRGSMLVDGKVWRQVLARRRGGRLRSPSFAEVLYTVIQHALLPLSRGAADIYPIACGLPATVP